MHKRLIVKNLMALVSAIVLTSGAGAVGTAHADDLFSASGTITATITHFDDGGEIFRYDMPDGSVMSVPYPPASFNPVSATDELLARYMFEPRPTEPAELADWQGRLGNYSRGASPELVILNPVGEASNAFTTSFGDIWGGWAVGTAGTVNHNYVAVKGTFTVPSVSTNTNCYWYTPYGYSLPVSPNAIGVWVGLGGDGVQVNDLTQQGLAWCGLLTADSKGYRPGWWAFDEFANTKLPEPFCGYAWQLPVGDTIYQNSSFQSSTNTAYYYMSDESPGGLTRSCSRTAPTTGWSFNGNIAEWIIEKNAYLGDFGTVNWAGVMAETASDSTFHTISSQPNIRYIIGTNSSNACVAVSNVTGNTNFSVTLVRSTC